VHVVDEPAGARDEPVAAQPRVRLAYHGDDDPSTLSHERLGSRSRPDR